VDGIVLRADAAARQVVVSHRPVEGLMPAMTMPFEVRRAQELASLQPGSRVTFRLTVSKQRSTADRFRIYQPPPDPDAPKLQWPQPRDPVAIGGVVPDFTLKDQNGRSVSLSSLRGRVVVIDFIYTRCPLPEVCPRLSATFAYLQKAVPEAELLSITIDPEYDTPEVLAAYARRWNAGLRWRFLTGNAEEIVKTAGHFGLVYWPEEGAVVHSVAIAVVDREGKLAARLEGASHRPDQVRDLVRSVIDSR
jgi:protein SCO1/2